MKNTKLFKKAIACLIMASMMIVTFVPSFASANSSTDEIELKYKATDSLTDADKDNGV